MCSAKELLAWSLLGLLGLAALIIALRLEPDARGHGTHEQFGLPPCDILSFTGQPCPTCGYTTAVSLLAHGRPLAALIAQPAGCLIGACLFSLPLLWASVLLTRRPLLSRLLDRLDGRAVLWILALVAGSWLYKLLSFQ